MVYSYSKARNHAVTALSNVIWFPLAAHYVLPNGSQLAKMKKEYSWHVPAMKFTGMKQLVLKAADIL